MLLYFVRWLAKETKLPMRVLLREEGPLVADFGQVAETVVIQSQQTLGSRAVRKVQSLLGGAQPGLVPEKWKSRSGDLIYANTVTNGRFVSDLRGPNTKVITHVHELGYWIEQSGAQNWGHVVRESGRFIAASRAVRNDLVVSRQVPAERVDVVHEFVVPPAQAARVEESAGIRDALGIPRDAFVVGGSGWETWRKGKDLFVQLAAAVSQRNGGGEIHFLWVGQPGDGEERYRLLHDARLAGVESRLHWSGHVPNAEPYFQEIDVFAMVSREDPFPLVCLEAGGLGKPVLCFENAGGMPEFVEEDAGFIVPYLNVAAMAERIVQLKDDVKLRFSLGSRAREKVLTKYLVEHAGPQILRIIEDELCKCR
ncbi:glycosyltransferase family 4 protein [Planctellipticum variicoloris]|uniref:glycosyltransferase family 4 protein n=1 Tax=Planctellipticum variicoloris TaxID=3064265 RepID=UPI0030137D58